MGIGEALLDVYDDKMVLAGAPLNVAVHAHQLAQPRGGRGVVVSRVGQDDLGQRVADELAQRGMCTDYLQTDPDRDTGRAYVSLDEHGQPTFQIVQGAAWDVLQFDPDDEDLARRCDAVCFGTLAQRDGQSRNSIYRFLNATTRRAVRLFDANLRQDYYNQQIIRRSCELATAVKLNEHELSIVCDLLGLSEPSRAAPGQPPNSPDTLVHALLKKFDLNLVALTRGSKGTVLFTPTGKHEAQPVSYPPAAAGAADPVGAGDACAAGLLVGLVLRLPLDRTLQLANHAGAFVASQGGATPTLPNAILKMVKTSA